MAQTPDSKYRPAVVFSIHGIRTHGNWQKEFAGAMGEASPRVESFDYGKYGLYKFLIPPFNRRMIDKFYEWYSQTVKTIPAVDLDCYDRRPSAVAHSLGTWILCSAMLKFPDMRFDKLVLTGSVLPRDFDWCTLFARDQVSSVRKECGRMDRWPGLARRFVANTGTAGVKGFEWFDTQSRTKPKTFGIPTL